jgi:hypothetical protein
MFATTGPPQVGQTKRVGVDCGEVSVGFGFICRLLSGEPGPDNGREDSAHKDPEGPFPLQGVVSLS